MEVRPFKINDWIIVLYTSIFINKMNNKILLNPVNIFKVRKNG